MRAYAWPVLVAFGLAINACGSDQTATDAGMDGGRAGRGGAGGRGGSAARGGAGGSTAGATGGSTTGTGGTAGTDGGTGGSTAGTGGGTAGSTGGSTAGTGGGTAGSTGGSTAGTGGGTAGSTGGSTAGRGGSTAGTGGGSAGTGGSTAGTGGGTGGSTAGTSGGTGGGTGGSTAGTTGAGGSTAGTTGAGGSTAGTTGAGGSTAGTGGGSGGAAGTGGAIACTSASTCPGGADDECKRKTCISNVCGMDFTAANTPVTGQTAEDCKRNVCDGIGGVMAAIDDADPPSDDGNACTSETCVNGMPTRAPEPARTACTQNGGMLCNGSSSAPACVSCIAATDCPGTDSVCHQRVCGNQNTCGFSNALAGTAAEPDATGNCRKDQCDGLGGKTSVADNSDTPADDGNPCTDDVCATGAPAHPPKADGTSCAQAGGTVCVGGTCAQCQTASECAGLDTTCRTRICSGSGVCGYDYAPLGTPAGTDAPRNCTKPVCDGAGAVISGADDADLPVDDNPCTRDVCTNGTPSNPNTRAGTICVTDGSKACDGVGGCDPLTFRVVRVGNGTVMANGTSAPVFVEEYRTDGVLVSTVALPTAASGSQNPLTISNSASSEGCLSLSADGRYLMLAGYATAPATSGVVGTMSSAVNRVAGRIDVDGNIDTSVAFSTAFNTNNVRSAASTDGAELWAGGGSNGTPASGGVWYNASSGQVRILTMPDSTRCVSIFGNQLFGTSGDSPYVFQIGFGTPTTAGQTASALTGLVGTSPFGIAAFNLGGSALDTIYVADGTNGLRRYALSGTTLTTPVTLTGTTVRGVAGYAAGTTVTLMASTAEATGNHLIVFVDTGNGTPTGYVVADAPMNTVFRGVAVSPHFPAP